MALAGKMLGCVLRSWVFLGCRNQGLCPTAGGCGSFIPDLLSSACALLLCSLLPLQPFLSLPPATPFSAHSSSFPVLPGTGDGQHEHRGALIRDGALIPQTSYYSSTGRQEKQLLMLQIRLHRNRHVCSSWSCQRLPETLEDLSVLVCWSNFPQLGTRPPESLRLVRASLCLGFGVRCVLKGH